MTQAEVSDVARSGRTHPGVLVVGECLVDMAPSRVASPATGRPARPQSLASPTRISWLCPGGAAPMWRSAWPALGVRTCFAARFARDGFGPWLRKYFSDNGVDLSLSVDAPEPATLAAVTLDDQGRASYTFYGPETADWRWRESELPARTAGPGRARRGRRPYRVPPHRFRAQRRGAGPLAGQAAAGQ